MPRPAPRVALETSAILPVKVTVTGYTRVAAPTPDSLSIATPTPIQKPLERLPSSRVFDSS